MQQLTNSHFSQSSTALYLTKVNSVCIGSNFWPLKKIKIYKMRSNEKTIFVLEPTSSFWGTNLSGKPRNYWIQFKHTVHLLVRMHRMKTCGEMREEIHSSLTQAQDGGAWSTSRPCRFLSGESVPGYRWRRSWVGPQPVRPLCSTENPLARRE
jgi:hypothetical protein